ncbi:protein kinase [Frankia sp. AgB32]|nr:protein kinase [Frankia sp. AgB32]
MPTDRTASPHGRLGGRYTLGRLLGRGGGGVVREGEDTLLRRRVAIKELRRPPAASQVEAEVFNARVLREARAAARLRHPGLVTVYDVINADDRTWIVMEYVDGQSLAELIREHGRITPLRAARIGVSLAYALEAAHRAGVVHRDVKPGNVLVSTDGQARLTDFGIAVSEGDATLTEAGMLVGSPAYIPPERARGDRVGTAGDVWGLGATLFTAVEGVPPFEGDGTLAVLAAVVQDRRRPFRHCGPLRSVLTELLAANPRHRPSLAEARGRLREIADRLDEQTHNGVTLLDILQPDPTTDQPVPALDRPERASASPERTDLPSAPASTQPVGALPAQPGSPTAQPGSPTLRSGQSTDQRGQSTDQTGPSTDQTGSVTAQPGPSAAQSGPFAARPAQPDDQPDPSTARHDRPGDQSDRARAGGNEAAAPLAVSQLAPVADETGPPADQTAAAGVPTPEEQHASGRASTPVGAVPARESTPSAGGQPAPAGAAAASPSAADAAEASSEVSSTRGDQAAGRESSPGTPARPGQAARRRRLLLALVGGAVLIAVGLVLGLVIGGDRSGRDAATRGPAATASPSPTPRPTTSPPSPAATTAPAPTGTAPATSPSPAARGTTPSAAAATEATRSGSTASLDDLGSLVSSSTTPASAPEGYRVHRDATGWSAALPTDWQLAGGGFPRLRANAPSGFPDLLVEVQTKAGASAIGAWRDLEPTVLASTSGYHLLSIRPADGGAGTTAAIWEFTFTSGARTIHVLDLGLIRNGHGYALRWRAPEPDWSGSLAQLRTIVASFRPGP